MGVIENKPDKYFLCFGFDNFSKLDLEPFHLTFIYLGEKKGWTVEQVTTFVSKWFEACPFLVSSSSVNQIIFSKEAFFGPMNNVRVLLPQENLTLKNFYNDFMFLRRDLEKLTNYQGYPFNLHLTTNLKYFRGKIDKLYLCKNKYEVIQEWDLI